MNSRLPITNYRLRVKESASEDAGVAVLLSILIIGFLISIVLTLAAIFIPKLRLSVDSKNSVSALYSAESAVEWCFYTNRITVPPATPVPLPAMANGATYRDQNGGGIDPSDCQTSPAKIIGSYRGTTRAYEVSF